MITFSLLANIAILAPVCWIIFKDGPNATSVFGPKTASRDVLVAIYVAVLGFSVVLLGMALLGPTVLSTQIVLTLLGFQVVYKLLTVVTLGLGHTIAISNLLVVAIHTVTLVMNA